MDADTESIVASPICAVMVVVEGTTIWLLVNLPSTLTAERDVIKTTTVVGSEAETIIEVTVDGSGRGRGAASVVEMMAACVVTVV